MDYVACLDESYVTDARYRSIACCSLAKQHIRYCSERLEAIVAEHGLKEFKWSELKDRRSRNCANALLDFVFDELLHYGLRVDVLIWDTQDRRHQVKGRNDHANFERMFFHLLAASLRRRGDGTTWWIRADHCGGVDWETIHDCLVAGGSHVFGPLPILEDDLLQLDGFGIESFFTVRSHEAPVVQLADLFAGIVVFSGDKYPEYDQWLSQSAGQAELFGGDTDPGFSNRQRYRFEVLRELDQHCKKRRLGVSLETWQRLRTLDGKNPINFWLYEPQHGADKAPIKSGPQRQ